MQTTITQYMYPLLNNATNNGFSLAEVLVSKVDQLALWYRPVKELGLDARKNMGFLNAPMAYAIRSVFGWEQNNTYAGNHSCLYVCRVGACIVSMLFTGCSSRSWRRNLLPACTFLPWACLSTTKT